MYIHTMHYIHPTLLYFTISAKESSKDIPIYIFEWKSQKCGVAVREQMIIAGVCSYGRSVLHSYFQLLNLLQNNIADITM